ncbi:hypothetical protein TREMEDRAFT_60779 [Tremella mesenterica DSM 1558]|uniref:uncharacterized protein n=1 Tax=Tremella mesenterica (strain ATCC 24925 / CBS 8224 / DSM 1558 / NBRC 9311 / NRRL Y-6157 / RJB 2259-6 / UBC 559-6) TaxID=578456 RepID=UPI0003F4A651|nr:uncharacterized protein TREMEDRAFT_60779 [Tremella mesenterica DSM 1558]EIW71856.1 hypothetical protein TREMEDRAFT_60779 [Tremella mesenterica DSM 1558]
MTTPNDLSSGVSLRPLSVPTPPSRPSIIRPKNTPTDANPCNLDVERLIELGSGTIFWKPTSVRWEDDGTSNQESSLAMLLDWLNQPSNFDRFRNGYEQYDQKKASVLCAQYLFGQRCLTLRSWTAIRRKINSLHSLWAKAWADLHATGNGQDGRKLKDARPENREVVLESVLSKIPSIPSPLTSGRFFSVFH